MTQEIKDMQDDASEPSVEPTNSPADDNSNTIVSAKAQKKLFKSKKSMLATCIGIPLVCGAFGLYSYLASNDKESPKEKQVSSVSNKPVNTDIVYRTALDSKNFSEEELFAISYPFGKTKILNTKQYSRALFETINSIVVDPTGQALPTISTALETMPNANFGYSSLKIELNALPKQPLFIRLVTEKNGEPYAVRHYYLKADEARTVSFEGLSGGRYYLQILNLITQTPYVSTTFNMTSNGLITGNSIINFIKIKDIDHVFQLPLEDEDSVLLVEDIPIVLNADINREVMDFSKSAAIKEATMDDY